MLDEDVKLLGKTVTLIGQPLQALGKLAVDRSNASSASVDRPATLFYRPSSVVVGIVRHDV